jgi:lipopolysaccharide/colanic/teichoic acid biosynthesis glycosyltransferase
MTTRIVPWDRPGNRHSSRKRRGTARPRWTAGKRAFDIALSGAMLVAIAPFFALIAIAIKLDSPGPVFYRVRRVGYRGYPLMMLKFRKMHDNAKGSPLTAYRDSRLTHVGRFLTSTRLDELPQLWDVLCGRMSIIGPRPEDPQFVALHPADYKKILSVRPGMTGLAQLAYAAESEIVDDGRVISDYISRIMPQKLRLDTLYVDRLSLRLDLSILRWTVAAVLFSRAVAVNRQSGKMNTRRRKAHRDLSVEWGASRLVRSGREASSYHPAPERQHEPG